MNEERTGKCLRQVEHISDQTVIKHSSIKCRTLTPKLFNQNVVLTGYDVLIECFSQIGTKCVLLSFMTVNPAVYNVRTIRNTINIAIYVI